MFEQERDREEKSTWTEGEQKIWWQFDVIIVNEPLGRRDGYRLKPGINVVVNGRSATGGNGRSRGSDVVAEVSKNNLFWLNEMSFLIYRYFLFSEGLHDTMQENGEAPDGGDDLENDSNYQFYKEYCRLYYANIILTNRLQQLLNEKKDL